jgi:hypothetical protein
VTRSRSRVVAGIAITVVLTVAVVVVLLTQGRHPASEAVTTTEGPARTTQPPATTAKPNPPNATGENWLAIMSDILTYRHSLYQNPQPDLLDQIYDKRCPCYAQERAALLDLARKGWRYHDNGVKVLKAKLLGRGTGKPPSVALDVVERVYPEVLVDRSGKTIQRRPGSSARTTTYELVQGDDLNWRVSFVIPR